MISLSDDQTEIFGNTFAQTLKKGAVIALYGELGAGKTTFVKGVVEALTSFEKRQVQSPTYSYLNIYEASMPIFHFDLYRLKKADGFIQMGFLDYFEEKEGICLIEWPQRIEPLLPKDTLQVHFSHLEKGKRKIDVYQS